MVDCRGRFSGKSSYDGALLSARVPRLDVRASISGALACVRETLTRPVPALSVDLFRVLGGLLALAYFGRHLVELRLYHGADALVPHEASRAAFPFTWQPLFPSFAGTAWIGAVYAFACALAIAVVLGVRPRSSAALLYAIVVATYHHDFLVMFVDDVVVNLVLFWLVILPIGTSLRVGEVLRSPREAFARARGATVRGTAVRLFCGNLALLYFVAGTSKWTSPLWRSGDALYAVLRLPMSFVADVIAPPHAPLLRVLAWGTLFVEPLLAVGIVLSSRVAVRRAVIVAMLVLHLGIVATVDAPFANLGCLAAIPLLFRGDRGAPPSPREPAPLLRGRERVGATVLALLFAAMGCALFAPSWRAPDAEGRGRAAIVRGATAETGGLVATTIFGALWCAGLAQQYRLLDWIDDRNFSVTLRFVAGDRVVAADRVLPRDMRSSLLLSYLGGVTWMPVPPEHVAEVRAEIAKRIVARACRELSERGEIALVAEYERTMSSEPGPRSKVLLAKGRCTDTAPLAAKETR